jgi:hypothetical protein
VVHPGEQVLACEWVCVRLARWFGLPTFKAAILDLPADRCFDLPAHNGNRYRAEPGPCFVTQATAGHVWDRSEADLRTLVNPDAITLLVAFDTWVLNRDRYLPDPVRPKANYGNVFLAEYPKAKEMYELVAMDHTHCFDNGQLHRRLSQIGSVKDDRVYGLFPQFRGWVDPAVIRATVTRLKAVTAAMVEPFIADVPDRWGLDAETRVAWREQIVGRARHLGDHLPDMVDRALAAGGPASAG